MLCHINKIKQEFWWLYIADKKKHQIISAPTQICNLKDQDEVSCFTFDMFFICIFFNYVLFYQIELKFLAPKIPGNYTYSVHLRSDSYLDMDLTENFKVNFAFFFLC